MSVNSGNFYYIGVDLCVGIRVQENPAATPFNHDLAAPVWHVPAGKSEGFVVPFVVSVHSATLKLRRRIFKVRETDQRLSNG